MQLNHVALNIINVDDVIDFYQNILGMKPEYQFELPATLSHAIFGVNQSLAAYFCKNNQLAFELFVLPETGNNGVAHICLEIPNREKLIAQCKNKAYKISNIKRDNKANLLFVWDKSGNCFEIKETMTHD